MKKYLTISLLILSLLGSVGCGESGPKSRAVCLLLDTSGTYTQELKKAQAIINYLLATLGSGDSIAVARIDSGSFSEKDIVAKTTFDMRPSVTNNQKHLFKEQINQFVKNIEFGSSNTDITGGVIQATDYINETGAEEKTILIFSDLEEDLQQGHVRNFPIDVLDIRIMALNVTKLRSDNIDPRKYRKRLDYWEDRVEKGGGKWGVINDLERLEKIVNRG